MTRSTFGKVGFGLLAFGFVLLGIGSALGLWWAPPEHFMGNVQKIMYVHVPSAWIALLSFTFSFGCALVFLFKRKWIADALLEASIEVGVVLSGLLCIQGAIWAKPTWGVWWAWDPRLTTMAVLLASFVGIVALRRFVDDPIRRAVWASVAVIIASANVPIVYFSVKWWNSMHQLQSNPQTVAKPMILPLRINAFAILFIAIGLVLIRARAATLRRRSELAPPPAGSPA